MIPPIQVLAQTGNGATLEVSETVSIVLIGFGFVMVVLAVLAMVTAAIGAFFARAAAREARKAAEAAARIVESTPPTQTRATPSGASAPSKPAEVAEEDEDPLLIAVIAAAVHTAIGGRPHRVIAIHQGGPGWAQEGRRQIFSSHRIR